MLGSINNLALRFRTKNWAEVNHDARGAFNTNTQIKFKTTTLKSSLCGYSDAYTLVKGILIITGVGTDAAARQVDKRKKQATLKNVHHLLTESAKQIINRKIMRKTWMFP